MKYILLTLIILIVAGFSLQNTVNLISDTAVTSSNDTLVSGWINADYNNIELMFYVDDTMSVQYYIDYRSETLTEITLAVDSIVTRGTALSSLSKGVVLRGYGASAVTNLIPGANQFRVRSYRNTVSEATGSYTVNATLR